MSDRIYKPIHKDVYIILLTANEQAMPKAWERFISPDFNLFPAQRVFETPSWEIDMDGRLDFDH